jgi:hypothetical protein
LQFECLEGRQLLTVAAPVNVPPRALQDNAVTVGNTPVAIDVLRNDVDPDGSLDQRSVVVSSGPQAGKVALRSDGWVVYTPPAGRLGTDYFFYNVRDNQGALSNGAKVLVSVRSVWQNPDNPFDVNADGDFSPIDILRLLNEINHGGSRPLPQPAVFPVTPPPYADTTGDGLLTPADVILAINCLNSHRPGGSLAACQLPPLPALVPAPEDAGVSASGPYNNLPADSEGGTSTDETPVPDVIPTEDTSPPQDTVSDDEILVPDEEDLIQSLFVARADSPSQSPRDDSEGESSDELWSQLACDTGALLPGGLDELALL